MKKLLILLLFLAPLGCAKDDGNGGDDGGSATSSAIDITGDETYTAEIVKISVPGMVWGMACPPRVKGALEELPGVAAVQVDYNAKTATCKVDADQFDKDAAVTALADAQFADSVVQ